MSKYTLDFKDVELIYKDKRVVFEWIGEGKNCDYDVNDPDDVPLLRFSCDRKDESGNWEGLEDASYVTQLPIHTRIPTLTSAMGMIMDAIQDYKYKRRLEELSWLCPEDFNEKVVKKFNDIAVKE